MTRKLEGFWDRRLSESWNLRGVGDRSYSRRYNYWLYKAKERSLKRVFKLHEIDVTGSSVLDVGSGIGYWLRWYRDQGALAVTGIELSGVAAERLKALFPNTNILHDDIAECDVKGSSFDVVSALDVICHMVSADQFRKAITNMALSLKPGGWLLISDLLGSEDVRLSDYLYWHSLRSYINVLPAAGCAIVQVYPYNGLLNDTVFNSVAARSGLPRPLLRHLEELFVPLLYQIDGIRIPTRICNRRLLVARRVDSRASIVLEG